MRSSNKNLCSRLHGGAAVLLIVSGFCAPLESQAETRGFVVSMLHTATYKHENNCPRGGNGSGVERRQREFETLGVSQDIIDGIRGGDIHLLSTIGLLYRIGKIDGYDKRVPVVFHPDSVPEPNVEAASGPYAYGFNLDGQGADDPGAFRDPETQEPGVDNQLFRAVGCFKKYDVSLPSRPGAEDVIWDVLTDIRQPPAWIFTISGDDLSRDGEVTVTFYKAVEHLRRTLASDGLADMTYVVDPNPHNHGVFKGVLKNGVFVSEPGGVDMMMVGSGYPGFTQFKLSKARLRLQLQPDRNAVGYIAGYQPWLDFWVKNTHVGGGDGLDFVSLYHLLRQTADAEPDPVSGQNTAISATYRIESVPAFIARPDGTFITDTHLSH